MRLKVTDSQNVSKSVEILIFPENSEENQHGCTNLKRFGQVIFLKNGSQGWNRLLLTAT